MAPRNDDATAAQHGTPTRDKSSQSDRTGSKTDTPPQTPGVPTRASTEAFSHLSSSFIPTPPSSGRSTAHANRHHRRPSAALRAARAFLSSAPSPLSPPAAPSPPASPPTATRRMAWPTVSAASVTSSPSSSSSAATTMPSTPRIPREETPEVSQIPSNQAFCACCDNKNNSDSHMKGKQPTTSNQGHPAVQCAVHGDEQCVQVAQPAQTSSYSPREREPGSMTKVEAQLQAARAYMMRRRGKGSISEGASGSSGSSQDTKQKGTGQQR